MPSSIQHQGDTADVLLERKINLKMNFSVVIYIVMMIAVIVGVDLLFF